MKVLALALAVGLCYGLHHAFVTAKAFRHAAAGVGQMLLDEEESAADELDRAVALNDRPSAYLIFAADASREAGRQERAIEAMSVLVDRYPEDAGYYERRADIYASAKQREIVLARLDDREPDREMIALWDQLAQADLRRFSELGGDVGGRSSSKQPPLKMWQIDPDLYGIWLLEKVNGERVRNGDFYVFTSRDLRTGKKGAMSMPVPIELDTRKTPKRLTLNYVVGRQGKYSYRIDDEGLVPTLYLGTRGGLMDPPEQLTPGSSMLVTIYELTLMARD